MLRAYKATVLFPLYFSHSTPEETSIQIAGRGDNSSSTLYNTSSLHAFIRETFPGAVLLEEHQVCIKLMIIDPVYWSPSFFSILIITTGIMHA